MSSRSPEYGNAQTRAHILRVSWDLIANHGSALRLTEVAAKAGVSRQALYLHFSDRAGLVIALVQHMDKMLDLGAKLAHVRAAQDGAELLERLVHLNHQFWTQVLPVARILVAAQDDDPELRLAWRDRMAFRQKAFEALVQRIADLGDLSPEWTVSEAAELLYATTHFDSWRELTQHLGWTEERYAAGMVRFLHGALLTST